MGTMDHGHACKGSHSTSTSTSTITTVITPSYGMEQPPSTMPWGGKGTSHRWIGQYLDM